MSVYAFYIFDRHTECIYSKRWTPQPTPSPGGPANNTLTTTNAPVSARQTARALDNSKLLFGTIFSLRRMIRQLGGPGDNFLSYRTGEYKLHYFETPTQLKLIMLTSVGVGNMRTVLYQIWATLFVEYVVKSPLVPQGGGGGKGVANELFEGGLERFIESIFAPQPQ